MNTLKINGYSNLVKDPTSGGVINNNPEAYIEYKKKRELAALKLNEKKALENKVLRIENDINKLKSDVNDIKEMLNSIISKLN